MPFFYDFCFIVPSDFCLITPSDFCFPSSEGGFTGAQFSLILEVNFTPFARFIFEGSNQHESSIVSGDIKTIEQ